MSKTFLLGAELGDSIYALPTIQSLGGGILYAVDRPWCRPDWERRVEAARRLFESQGLALRIGQPSHYDVDLTTYRNYSGKAGDNIATRIARWAGVSIDTSKPWIQVEPSKATQGRIIVSRGPRWRGEFFPWQQIVNTFQSGILFVGTNEEYSEFCASFGHVERHHTKDLLEVAEAIAGSALFIGSQSSPNALCEALKHPSVLEVCPTSIDCFYDRATTQYCIDGQLQFEALGKTFTSPSHHEQTNKSFRYSLLLNNRIFKHDDEVGLLVHARAECRRKGFVPLLDELKQMIVQHSPQRTAYVQ